MSLLFRLQNAISYWRHHEEELRGGHSTGSGKCLAKHITDEYKIESFNYFTHMVFRVTAHNWHQQTYIVRNHSKWVYSRLHREQTNKWKMLNTFQVIYTNKHWEKMPCMSWFKLLKYKHSEGPTKMIKWVIYYILPWERNNTLSMFNVWPTIKLYLVYVTNVL